MAELGKLFGAAPVETFLGWPAADAAHGAQIALIGADMATPYHSVGPYCAGAPQAIRRGSADYSSNSGHMNFDLDGPVLPAGVRAVDLGDVVTRPEDPAGNRNAIRDAVRSVRAARAVPIVFGGDDSVPIPMIEALDDDGPLTILQIDAHIDWRDALEGERLGLSSTMRRASEMAHVERIVQVGARGVGSARESDFAEARAWGSAFLLGREVAREGVARAVALVPEGARVVIAFDCDALDPSVMPAVIAPTAGGLTYMQTLDLIEGVAERAEIVAFDMVEFLPDADTCGAAAVTAAQLAAAVAGIIARQVAPQG